MKIVTILMFFLFSSDKQSRPTSEFIVENNYLFKRIPFVISFHSIILSLW